MFSRKRGRAEENRSLAQNVKDLVKRVCDWEDACGAKFTVETSARIGEDFVILDIFGLDEINMKHIQRANKSDPCIASHSCHFATTAVRGKISFVFENTTRTEERGRVVVADETELQSEIKRLSQLMPTVRAEDIRACCRCICSAKHEEQLEFRKIRITATNTPGVVTIEVHGLSRLGDVLLQKLRQILDEDENVSINIYIERSYLQFNIKKKRSTVNI